MGQAASYQPPPQTFDLGGPLPNLDLGGPPLGVHAGGAASVPPGGAPGSAQSLGMLSWSPLQPPQLIPPTQPMQFNFPPLGSPMQSSLDQQKLGMAGPPPLYPWPMY